MSQINRWLSQMRQALHRSLLLVPIVSVLVAPIFVPDAAPVGQVLPVENAAAFHNQSATDHHLRRCLDDASREYAVTLQLDPPRALTTDEWELIRRFAPRLYVTPAEPFSLKDVAAVVHPRQRLIAYHFFWEDDIDFPEDNDPSDHEVIWAQYSQDRRSLEQYWTYFHGRLLTIANHQHTSRPKVFVQWGKHGSMPVGWERLALVPEAGDKESDSNAAGKSLSLLEYNRRTYVRLSREGCRLARHPLARQARWPERFSGRWEDFIDFSRSLEPLEWLAKKKMAVISEWNSAVLNQRFIAYNFRPKLEWPPYPLQRTVRLSSETAEGQSDHSATSNLPVKEYSIEDLQLPAKSIFPSTMPRYPNVWFYVSKSLAPTHQAAVGLVTSYLQRAMQFREFYLPNSEGCDFEGRLEHLQPWEDRGQRQLQHAHAFHLRYYFSSLNQNGLSEVVLRDAGREFAFYRMAASAHYEVEHTNPNHADVEICPVCGRTGDYAGLKGNLVELVHDPLGLELMTQGTIRGVTVRLEDWKQEPVGSVNDFERSLSVRKFVFPGMAQDRNTQRIGVILLGPK